MQKLGCYSVIGRYLTQPHKWADLLGIKKGRKINLAELPPEQLLASK
jgi:hypothetical protein